MVFLEKLGFFGRNVVELTGIGFEIKQLVSRALGEGKIVEALIFGRVVFFVDEVGFGRPVVGIAIPGVFDRGLLPVGSAIGPAAGCIVADVEILMVAIGAGGIAAHIGGLLTRDVAFFSGENEGAEFHVASSGERGEEVFAGHVFGYGHSGRGEEGGSKVGKGGEILEDLAGFNFFSPADGERNARATVVEVRLAAWKGHAVITGDDDDGVVEFTNLFELDDGLCDVGIEALHFEIVIRNIVTDFLVIGEVWEDLDLCDVHAGLFSRSFFVAAMRVAGTEPEAEGCVFVGSLGEKGREALFVNLSRGVVLEEFSLQLSGAE